MELLNGETHNPLFEPHLDESHLYTDDILNKDDEMVDISSTSHKVHQILIVAADNGVLIVMYKCEVPVSGHLELILVEVSDHASAGPVTDKGASYLISKQSSRHENK